MMMMMMMMTYSDLARLGSQFPESKQFEWLSDIQPLQYQLRFKMINKRIQQQFYKSIVFHSEILNSNTSPQLRLTHSTQACALLCMCALTVLNTGHDSFGPRSFTGTEFVLSLRLLNQSFLPCRSSILLGKFAGLALNLLQPESATNCMGTVWQRQVWTGDLFCCRTLA